VRSLMRLFSNSATSAVLWTMTRLAAVKPQQSLVWIGATCIVLVE
jgi:hypothetical protein